MAEGQKAAQPAANKQAQAPKGNTEQKPVTAPTGDNAPSVPATNGAAAAPAAPAKKPKSESTPVKMLDGRTVEFPGKRRLQKESFIDAATGEVTVRLDFRNGETRTYKPHPKLIAQLIAHGAEQKLGDEISGVEDIDDAVEAIDKLIDRLNTGEWTLASDGASSAGESVLLKAIVEVTKADKDKVRAYLKDKTPAQKAALRASADFAPVVKRLEQEKLAKKPAADVSKELAELKALATA